MLAALHHPNVVQCHGATVEGAVLHIAMEYLSGGDLASLIERRAAAHEPFAEQEAGGALQLSNKLKINSIIQLTLGSERASGLVIHTPFR